MKKIITISVFFTLLVNGISQQPGFHLNDPEYFENGGVNAIEQDQIWKKHSG